MEYERAPAFRRKKPVKRKASRASCIKMLVSCRAGVFFGTEGVTDQRDDTGKHELND